MTEEDIIEGCKKNDGGCQRILFEQYSGKLMTVCFRYAGNRHEAEDMLQESFVKIFKHIQQYRNEGPLEGWVKRIVVNCCLRILQKKKIVFSKLEDAETTPEQSHFPSAPDLTQSELLKIISSLPTGYRIIFNLYALEGYSHAEIAVLLDIEAATSRSQLAKARKLLQKKILAHQKIAV